MVAFPPHASEFKAHAKGYRDVPDFIFRILKFGLYQYTYQNACFCLFFSNNQNDSFLHTVGPVQGRRLQHEGAFERTILTICFTGDHLYASTLK